MCFIACALLHNCLCPAHAAQHYLRRLAQLLVLKARTDCWKKACDRRGKPYPVGCNVHTHPLLGARRVAWVSEANTGARLRIPCEQGLRCRELVQCLGLDSGFLACLLASHGGCRALGGPHQHQHPLHLTQTPHRPASEQHDHSCPCPSHQTPTA